FRLPPQRLARRRRPVLYRFITLGIAIISSFEITERNDKTRPAVDEAQFENVMFEKRPRCMSKCAHHCYALVRELRNPQGGIPVCFPQHFFEVAEWKLPNCIAQRAYRFSSENFIAFMDRFKRVSHAALAEELGLPEVWIPARAADPAPHHETAARHAV